MAVPLTPGQILAALRGEGLALVPRLGWTTHNRNGHGAWGPVNGVMIHHTAGTSSANLVWDGTPDLPGPLAHAHLAKNGKLTLMSSGRANHAGRGSQAVFDAVVQSRPVPAGNPGPDAVDGNAHFYGLEIENLGNGRDPYPPVQYEAAVKWAAAVCRVYGWDEYSVIGHREWTTRKIDPSFSMAQFRRDVREQLEPKESTVAQIPGKDIEAPRPQAYRDVMETDSIPVPSNLPGAADQGFWTAESYLRYIAEALVRIEKKLAP